MAPSSALEAPGNQPFFLNHNHAVAAVRQPDFPGSMAYWANFLQTYPVMKMLRPDFFIIYRLGDNPKILYQQNFNLDLGGPAVTFENILQHLDPNDLQHMTAADKVMMQLIRERKLQAWDYVHKIGGNLSCPNSPVKRIMRSSMLIHRDSAGRGNIGLHCFHDVTRLVSSLKPFRFELACAPELSFLSVEMESRLQKSHVADSMLTAREQQIIERIRKGMSSKAIAAALFIAVATVNTHRQNMLRKLKVPNTAALLEKWAMITD